MVNSLHENTCFSMVSVFRGGPPHLGHLPSFLPASCWLLAGFLLASCWLLAGLLLASCWLLAVLFLAACRPLGFLLASSFPTRISLENRFFKELPKLVNSLHENACFSMVSVFRGVPPIWGLLLASCWLLAGFFLASCWLPRQSILPEHSARAARQSTPPEHRQSIPPEHPARAGFLLASCWLLPGLLLAPWLFASVKFPHADFSRKSVFQRARKTSEFSS